MAEQKDFSRRIIVGITGCTDGHWETKLGEINERGISRAALFLERFNAARRRRIYRALGDSALKAIPLVHLRNDMEKWEIEYLVRNFGSSYLTIHEDSFKILEKWSGFYKRLFLEMNTDNVVPRAAAVNRIGGFCIDLSHFKVEEESWSKEFEYIMRRRRTSKYFSCNHLNGYSPERNADLHTVKSLKDFDYLKTLPLFLFGDCIALETENSIREQLEFKEYLSDLLGGIFGRQKA